jgi:hypothetical protein
MSARRAVFDPLERNGEPHWYVVRNMHGAVLERRTIAGDTDLKRLFITAMLEWVDAGWQLGEFSSCAGTFFCSRAGERRVVTIQSKEPT